MIELNDEVCTSGHVGRFVVIDLKEGTAVIQLFGDHSETGARVYFTPTMEVPLGALTVIGKNHKRPSVYTVVG